VISYRARIHPCPTLQLVIVYRQTAAATGEDEHPGADQLITDVGGWAGIPGTCGDSGGLRQMSLQPSDI
jgi:hypothetical protein